MAETPNIPARPLHPSEMERAVSLREFEQRMDALKQQINDQLRAQRELVDTRAASVEKERIIQAAEYERRLTELNHAHETAMENWRTSLPRELFEQHQHTWQQWRDETSKQLTLLTQLPMSMSGLDARISGVDTRLDVRINGIDTRVKVLEQGVQRMSGALWLLGFAGAAGIVALLIGVLRLARVIP